MIDGFLDGGKTEDVIEAFEIERGYPGRTWHQAKIFLENPPEPEQLPPFCSKCGAKNISACQHCRKAIEKQDRSVTPAYCVGCGKLALKGTFVDLTSDTARTSLAATRFNNFIKKIGPVAGGVLKQIVVSVATEAAKKSMGPP